MPRNSMKLSLSAVALIVATSGAFAQSTTGTPANGTATGSMQAMPRTGEPESAMGRSTTSGGLGNSTNRLENGTASGKGSGPGGGSPNGN